MRRALRWAWRGALGGLALLVLAAGAIWLVLDAALPQLEGELALPGLRAPVSVVRDDNGVPYIKAANEHDAYLALGFVHAQDRMAQMEFMRRTGAGRLSELLGAATLRIDRSMRTLGLYRRAEADVAGLPPDVRTALEAYAAGVNAWIAVHDGPLPLEFQLLWHEPEPWRPADSLVWGRLMALRLTDNWGTELLRARLAARWPRERIDALWPPYPDDAPTSIAAIGGFVGAGLAPPASSKTWPESGPALGSSPRVPGPYEKAALDPLLSLVDPADGSNAWVVSGERSSTGKPVLANDPHLGFTMPNLWYLAHLETSEWRVTGATVPGVPFTVLGHNGAIAWGLTTTHGDASDLFVERLDPADPQRYLTPDGSAPFETREETIRVRGGKPVRLVVRETRHGPVLSDIYGDAERAAGPGHVMALAHTALLPGDVNAEAMYRANRAPDWPSFAKALRTFRSPMQNVVYADGEGNIGFFVAARVPVRQSGDGSMPVPGWTGKHDWTGFIPFGELPRALNPPRGRIVNANNKPVGPDYPFFLGQDWPEPYRAVRIEHELASEELHAPDDSEALQRDVVSLAAVAILPHLLRAPVEGERARSVTEALAAWDFQMDATYREPLVYAAWVRETMRAIFADELGDAFAAWWDTRPLLLSQTLERDAYWCDDIGTAATESCDARIALALDRALDGLAAKHGSSPEGWRWGEAHRARFAHKLLGRVPAVGRLLTRTVETGGGNFTVNRGGMDIGNPETPFAHVHGAGYRAVYDLGDLDDSRFIQAIGQSGHILSPHHADLMALWRDGYYIRLVTPEEPAHALTLTPEGR